MRNQKAICLILVLIILIISAGCVQETTDSALAIALEVAYADFSLMKLTINGSEYTEITAGKLINPQRYYQETIFGVDGVTYDVNAIKQLNEEEFSNLKENLYISVKESELADIELTKSVFASEIFDDTDFSFKYVFVRGENITLGKETYFFRKYTLKENGDKWQVLTFSEYVDFIEEPRTPDTMQRYLEYDGNKITYSREIELAE